jgi:hypothetical protein
VSLFLQDPTRFSPPTYLIQKRVSLILFSDRRQPDGSDCIFFQIVCIIKTERKKLNETEKIVTNCSKKGVKKDIDDPSI